MHKELEYYEKDNLFNIDKYAKGSYKIRNEKMCYLLSNFKFNTVFEFGGAEGQLAKYILKNKPGVLYHFSDFSINSVNHVKDKLSDYHNAKVYQINMETELDSISFDSYDLIISNSLEHIKNDIDIIDRIKKGSIIALCLPNFPSDGHIRHFNDLEDIKDRYGFFIDFKVTEKVCIEPTRFTWLKVIVCGKKIFPLIEFILFHIGVYTEPIPIKTKWIVIGIKK